jgi:hypothetical protein
MAPAGFETAIPASERSQTHAFGRAATGIDRHKLLGRPNQRQWDGGGKVGGWVGGRNRTWALGTSVDGGVKLRKSEKIDLYQNFSVLAAPK